MEREKGKDKGKKRVRQVNAEIADFNAVPNVSSLLRNPTVPTASFERDATQPSARIH
jgi:hypothetical protein